MITSAEIKTWRQLQDEVARILTECGFTTEVERTLITARGAANIDVFAVESLNGRRNVIICECKHWKQRIPQTVVHAFRSVMADTGANTGYIIASNGFQAGCERAAAETNIQLVTWSEFQQLFETTWLERHLKREITHLAYAQHWLGSNQLEEDWELKDFCAGDLQQLKRVYEAHSGLAYFLQGCEKSDRFHKLPLAATGSFFIEDPHPLPRPVLEATAYREWLEAIRVCGLNGLIALHDVLERVGYEDLRYLRRIIDDGGIWRDSPSTDL